MEVLPTSKLPTRPCQCDGEEADGQVSSVDTREPGTRQAVVPRQDCSVGSGTLLAEEVLRRAQREPGRWVVPSSMSTECIKFTMQKICHEFFLKVMSCLCLCYVL